jgi:hypothetical protein
VLVSLLLSLFGRKQTATPPAELAVDAVQWKHIDLRAAAKAIDLRAQSKAKDLRATAKTIDLRAKAKEVLN